MSGVQYHNDANSEEESTESSGAELYHKGQLGENLSDSDHDGQKYPAFSQGKRSNTSPDGEHQSKKPRMSFTAGGSLSDSGSDDDGRPQFGNSSASGGTGNRTETNIANQFRIEADQRPQPQYNDTAQKMMAKMGYIKGKGLGKNQQGRADIVEASKHKGRRGLGMTVKGFEPSDVQWSFEKEVVSEVENVQWLPQCEEPAPDLDEMLQWIKIGKKKKTIHDETEFCGGQVLADVVNCKSVFDHLEGEEMRRARTRSNPYETIRGVFFLNRAAMKMANMDAVFDFMFTSPKDKEGKSLVQPGELLYFADICAGPGGFSEYILWRKKCDAKGFGFTLKGPCDFKLEDFFAAPCELFEPHYGANNDGDIYNEANLKDFTNFVWSNTDGKGVHFVMADGGFSVEGEENLQEILSKRLYLCQFLCALCLLREGGSFVCKLFDVFTPFSVGLIYLMYRAFDNVSIFKPVTSRPANSERYIICRGMRADAGAVRDYMMEINRELDRTFSRSLSDEDVTHVVPLEILQEGEFFNYILTSNESLGTQQAIALAKIQAFAQNTDLYETRQSEIRRKCLERWEIPDQARTAPDRSVPAFKRFPRMVQDDAEAEYDHAPRDFSTHSDLQTIHSVYDYHVVVSAGECRCFLFSLGRSAIFKWDGRPRSKWQKVDVKLELPANTVLEVEIVMELRGEGRGQKRLTAVHVIDGMFIYDVDIRRLHYRERIQRLQKFVKAITRPTRSDLCPIRVKDVFKLEEMGAIFDRLEMKVCKTSHGAHALCYRCGDDVIQGQLTYVIPRGVLLIKAEQAPWMLSWSRSSKRFYFYDTIKRVSTFDRPKESIAPYKACLKNRLYWAWTNGVKVHEHQKQKDPSQLSKDEMLQYVHKVSAR